MLGTGLTVRRRVSALLLAVGLILSLLAGRLGFIQFVRGSELMAKGMRVRLRPIPLQAPRGDILDRKGKLLAGNVTCESVYVIPFEARGEEKQQRIARALAPVLEMTEDRLLQIVQRRSYFEWIKRKVTPAQAQAVKQLNLPGVSLVPEYCRYYPEGSLAAHALGITGIDHQGIEGLEVYYDKVLRGTPGSINLEFDARGYAIVDGVKRHQPAVPGQTLVTTIDLDIQHLVEQALDRIMVENKPGAGAAIIVMDVQDGGILAMGQRPAFEPGNYRGYDMKIRRPWILANAYYPGSIFKPVTAAAALQEKKVTPTDTFINAGCINVMDRTICNYNSRPIQTATGNATIGDIIEHSSNVGFVQLGLRVGIDTFYQYLEKFGYTGKTGIDMPGEGVSLYPKKSKATQLDLAIMSFGQTLTATPLQMITALGAIANDGKLMRPHFMKELRDGSGSTTQVYQPQVRSQVVDPEVARLLQEYMARVVSDGTGRNAAVPGYAVAGKTGTAEKVQGGSGPKRYISSFVGFAPVPNPRFAMLVTIDEPTGVYYGGQIAAPVFGQLGPEILEVLGVAPSTVIGEGTQKIPAIRQAQVPSLLNLPVNQAEALAARAGFKVVYEGSGGTVLGQVPPAGSTLPEGARIGLFVGGPGTASQPGVQTPDTVHVPNLLGLDREAAARLLSDLGLFLEASGEGMVTKQEPAAGTAVKPGSRVKLWLEKPKE